MIKLKKEDTDAHARHRAYLRPLVEPKHFKTYPPGGDSSSLSSTQNFCCLHPHQLHAAPPERKSILTCCGRTPIPERSVPSMVSLFEAQRPCPGELCPGAARGHGTRTHPEWWRGRRVRSQTVGGGEEVGMCAKSHLKHAVSRSSLSSERVLQSTSRSVTSFARQQPVNRRLLSPPAVNS